MTNKQLFNQQFCEHFFSLENTNKNGRFAKCENSCELEWGEVLNSLNQDPYTPEVDKIVNQYKDRGIP